MCVFIDNSQCGSCAKVDDDGWYTIALCGSDSIGQSVLTQLRWRLNIDRDNTLGIGYREEVWVAARKVDYSLREVIINLRSYR